MAEASAQTLYIQTCLDRLRGGDETARSALLDCACERLRNLAHRMLKGYPNVHRWEQTDDVLQNAAIRLHRTLGQMAVETPRDFFRLAALNIRRELLDLARRYYGPQGLGARHASSPAAPTSTGDGLGPTEPPDVSHEPVRVAAWTEFHQQIEALPEEEREVVDLLWYQGLTQAEAAELLHVSERTVKRRWLSARIALREALQGDVPE
jgi:RNA polymerase sigma factor (sigma-70 family)